MKQIGLLLAVAAIFSFFASANTSFAKDNSGISSNQQELEEFKAALIKIPKFPNTGGALQERLLKITAGAEKEVNPNFVDDIFDVSAWPWKERRSIDGGLLRIDYGVIPIEGDLYIHLREIDKKPMWAFQMMLMHLSFDNALVGIDPMAAPKVMCVSDKNIIAAVLQQGWKLETNLQRTPQELWVGTYGFTKKGGYSIIMKFTEPKQNNDSCLTYMSVN
ncbi:hypothetical protein [Collimonas humicola]|uniref:hypothetical protein n=1 Tax=Collimonas humicola TaxID=2825886 RepID=UPI001B8C4DEB|nr:hypothetical protein [Collimonas humicola]